MSYGPRLKKLFQPARTVPFLTCLSVAVFKAADGFQAVPDNLWTIVAQFATAFNLLLGQLIRTRFFRAVLD
jgi:hypothetical protein